MSATPSDLFEYSLQTTTGSGETCLRSGISRAYYASYHGCKDWHGSLPTADQGHNVGPVGGKHQVLINQLCNPAGATDKLFSKGLGYGLKDLRTYRVTADYEMSSLVSPDYTSEAQEKARFILRKLKLVP
jgi:uncharacterized protein (UPF0332 family)